MNSNVRIGVCGLRAWRAAALLVALAGIAACSSGSGSSEVGNNQPQPPIARAQVLNAGAQNTFREGSEVLLSGKASEDYDGPLLYWRWQQTAGPTVTLVERNKTNVSFTAPDVSASTALTFRLTVEDSHGDTDQETVNVTVVPAQDADRFLALDVRGPNELHSFKVIAALANASTGATPAPFTMSARAYLIYPPRTAPAADCSTFDLTTVAGTLPAQTGSGCLIALLKDLTPASIPGGGTGIASEWPANVAAVSLPTSPTVQQLEPMWWNPQFTLELPRLDVADFNQAFVNSGDRNRMLDLFNAHRARIVLSLSLTAPMNQQAAALLVTSNGAEPTDPLISRLNAGGGLPTTAFIDIQDIAERIDGREVALTGEVYYKTVDPNDTRTTLNAWLQQAGFTADGRGTLIANAEDGVGEFAHAVYLNNYDLGFGRDMYTRTDQYGNVFAFVGNYATLEGAIRKVDSIATVVMEYSPLANASDATPKFVKFFTYVEDRGGDSRRVTSMNFDGRGEISTPGNCVICHGGAKPPGLAGLEFDGAACSANSPADRYRAACYRWPATNGGGDDIADGNLNSTFLPWDLDSLLFADSDPAITQAPVPLDGETLGQELRREFGDFSRNGQLAQLKRLNQAAYRTYCNAAQTSPCRTDAARKLLEHWYQGVDQSGNLAGTFSDATAPAGWRNGEVVATPTQSDPFATATNPATAEQLYHRVYAQNCRMCHTNILDSTLLFDNYQKLLAQEAFVESAVFERGVMPAARLTADRFWVNFNGGSSAAEALADELGVQPVAGQLGPAPRAVITGAPTSVRRNGTVRLSAHDSSFPQSYQWNVSFAAPAELAGNPAVANYQPTLVGATTADLALAAAMPGTYTTNLTINGAGGPTATPAQFVVQNFSPLACVDGDVTTPGGPNRVISFLQNDRFAVTGSGATCATAGLADVASSPDLPLTYSFVGATFNQSNQYVTPNGGRFTLTANAACTAASGAVPVQPVTGCADDTLTYQPPPGGTDSVVDTLSYVITDADGQSSAAAIVTVNVTANLAVTVDAVGTVVSDYDTPQLRFTISGGALANPGSSRYTVTVTTAPTRGTLIRGLQVLGLNSSFGTDQSVVTVTYVPNQYTTGAENVVFRITDSANTIRTAAFPFGVLPQAPFSALPSPAPGQLGAVMSQWTNCRTSGCHGTTGSTAQMYFDLRTTRTAAQVYSALLNGTSENGFGSIKVVPNDPDGSLIMTYPVNSGTGHTGLQALPLNSGPYNVIRRWILEGAQLN
jgi:hypothetical protein